MLATNEYSGLMLTTTLGDEVLAVTGSEVSNSNIEKNRRCWSMAVSLGLRGGMGRL